jgi:hypothetical protein
MARARNIKPSFFQNEELSDLTPIERLAFIGMWTISDFKGCFEYRPKRLKIQILPYDNCDIELITINLESSGFISTYSVLGQQYIKIINFVKHQNPHKNERDSGSEIPDIHLRDDLNKKESSQNNDLQNIGNNRALDGTNRDQNGTTRADSLLLIPDSPIPLIDSSVSGNAVEQAQEIPKETRFKKPAIDLVREHFKANGSSNVQADLFHAHYESNGWLVGKNKMRNWKAAATGWINRQSNFDQPKPKEDPNKWNFDDILPPTGTNMRTVNGDEHLFQGVTYEH